jgi:hypothetical protein
MDAGGTKSLSPRGAGTPFEARICMKNAFLVSISQLIEHISDRA